MGLPIRPYRMFEPKISFPSCGILIRSRVRLLQVPDSDIHLTSSGLPHSPAASDTASSRHSRLPSKRVSSRVVVAFPLLSPAGAGTTDPPRLGLDSSSTGTEVRPWPTASIGFLSGDAEAGRFQAPALLQLPALLHPVRETREKQVQLWKDLILDYCRGQKIHVISLEEDFPLFSNPKIDRSLSHEAKEVFLAALVSEGRAEWMDKGHKKCLILWLRIQDWANFIFNFVKDNGLEVMTIEEIRSGIDTRGTELEGIDRGVLMRALRLLEQKGKAAIFKGTSADDEGVKFSI
ncbi:hypothetical protein EJB05_17603, partial [Eragrostis curvula]